MKLRERNIAIGALVAGLLVGLIVGIVVNRNGDIYGTASGDEKEQNEAREAEATYYLVDLDVASEWLAEQYPDSEETLVELTETLSMIGATGESIGRQTAESEEQLDMMLAYTQSALLEEEEIIDDRESLPEDRDVTACIALDDDPWTDDPESESDVRVYLRVPDGSKVEEIIPKTEEWRELSEPKSEFDYGWMVLRCDPEEEE